MMPMITWGEDGVPVATAFDDPYYSLDGGLAEARHVFLAGNDLPERFRDGFHIAELGFGTGLNALAAWAAWRVHGLAGTLHFTSFEIAPLAPAQMHRALGNWPELAPLAAPLIEALERDGPVDLPGLHLEVIEGDARETLLHWQGHADAWFLDGFSPAKNPELWSPALMTEVARHSAPGATLATYSAAGHVRRALSAAGFTVTRAPGFGRKRHMTRGHLGARE